MKVPIYVKCKKCGEDNYINCILSDTEIKSVCKCGEGFSFSLSSSITIGERILEKSKYEFKINKDYNLSIVFAAMAFECELSNLFLIWASMNKDISDQELEKLLRKFGGIEKKIQEVSSLMFSGGINNFVENNPKRMNQIKKGFSSLNTKKLSKSLKEKLFWPRNRVLHLGFSGYAEEDAKKCFNIAALALDILSEMHINKSKDLPS